MAKAIRSCCIICDEVFQNYYVARHTKFKQKDLTVYESDRHSPCNGSDSWRDSYSTKEDGFILLQRRWRKKRRIDLTERSKRLKSEALVVKAKVNYRDLTNCFVIKTIGALHGSRDKRKGGKTYLFRSPRPLETACTQANWTLIYFVFYHELLMSNSQ